MPDLDVEEYARRLYSRLGEVVTLKRAEVMLDGGCWRPELEMCHQNVSTWCHYRTGFTAVRGWLYFDLPGLSFVKFVAHSAVRTPEGELFDITPSNASRDYPFLDSRLSEEEYAELVERRGYGEIHSPKGRV